MAGCPDLLARVDLIVEEDDAVVIRDFKTSPPRWNAANVESSDEQLMLYGERLSEEFSPGEINAGYQQPASRLMSILPPLRETGRGP